MDFSVFAQNQPRQVVEELPRKKVKLQDEPLQEEDVMEFDEPKADAPEFDIIHHKEECGCVHESFTPSDYKQNFVHHSKQAAKEYPFTLDPFQLEAVKTLEKHESVLVAAHTSAGKTAVAEYAIAMAKRDGQRVVYTSPIKALSNQKYRELQQEFSDVGLVTGDVTINQNAFCLVMTTEILRSMLYRGSEIVREVAWVIFDEVHYMRDKERGVVWEETLILVSPNVRFVFLSATIPNAPEFAEWICRIKHQPCHVVYTEYRPTPLQHYLCPNGADGIYLVVDEHGKFRDDQFQKAVGRLEEGGGNDFGGKKKKPTEGSDLFKLLKMIKERKLDPAIIFSFSKKEVEGYAMAMSKMDLTTPEEKEKIETVYKNAMQCLSEEDRQLPQIQLMLPILKKGIGIHHGGLLPIVKEIIEILFQEGWLKALFSTETFSMGLNMPSKTVVFTSVRKFDGENFRWIGGGEYIQMSGRAGRRGIDDKGICILIFDEKMDQEVAKSMLKGHSDALMSSFHLSYNMLINSIRMEDTDPEYIIKRSFHQFQNQKKLPEIKKNLRELEVEYDKFSIDNESEIKNLFEWEQQLDKLNSSVRSIINEPSRVLPFLAIGRLVCIKSADKLWGWGIYLNFNQKRANKKQVQIIIDVMIHVAPRQKNDPPQPADLNQPGEMEVVPMLLETLWDISSIKLNLPNDLKNPANKKLVKTTLIEITKQFDGKPPLIDPVSDMKIDDESLDKLLSQKARIYTHIKETHKYIGLPLKDIDETLKKYEQREKLGKQIAQIKKDLDENGRMVLGEELKRMKRVMRRLSYISQDEIVQIKGQVACELSACDEIFLTELLISGIFTDTTPHETAAVLSCLIYDENNASDKFMLKNPQLQKYFDLVKETGKKIFDVYQDCKIALDETEYMGQFKPQMMEVTLAWCQGSNFAQICKMTDIFEGSIIRCLRRLDELLKQLAEASKVIGNEELKEKFEAASKSLRRGIVFAASLYL